MVHFSPFSLTLILVWHKKLMLIWYILEHKVGCNRKNPPRHFKKRILFRIWSAQNDKIRAWNCSKCSNSQTKPIWAIRRFLTARLLQGNTQKRELIKKKTKKRDLLSCHQVTLTTIITLKNEPFQIKANESKLKFQCLFFPLYSFYFYILSSL